MCTGLYYKSFYKDINTEEEPLNKFVVALLADELAEVQIKWLDENLDSSPIIIAGKCDETSTYRFSCTTQKITVKHVFKGTNIKIGDKIEVARHGSGIFLDEENYINEKPCINMGFVNEMVVANTYLIFLEKELETYDENTIYIQSEEYIIAPIFSYEEVENIAYNSIDDYGDFIEYKDIKQNEFFLMSENEINNMNKLKAKLLGKYSLPCHN